MRDLDKELDQNQTYPPSWSVKEGEKVVGLLKEYQKAFTPYGEAWVCQIDDENRGMISVWLTHTVLLDWFKKLKPKVGERIGIKCNGKHLEKGYWQFKVMVDRDEPEAPDFDSLKAWDNPGEFNGSEPMPF